METETIVKRTYFDFGFLCSDILLLGEIKTKQREQHLNTIEGVY